MMMSEPRKKRTAPSLLYLVFFLLALLHSSRGIRASAAKLFFRVVFALKNSRLLPSSNASILIAITNFCIPLVVG